MTWTIVILLALAYFALILKIAHWVGGLLAEAELFLERSNAGECTCTRHRLCPACLELLKPRTDVVNPARGKAA